MTMGYFLVELLNNFKIELFYLNSTLNFGIPIVFVFQLEVYYKADRLLTGLTAQHKGTTARWYSNKTPLTRNQGFLLLIYYTLIGCCHGMSRPFELCALCPCMPLSLLATLTCLPTKSLREVRST